MNDDAAFIAALVANPNDDATRLVYADWLEERGDVRGEFLRLQHQLASILDRIQHVRHQVETEWASSVAIRRDLIIRAFDADQRHAVTKLARLHTSMVLEQARALLSNLPAAVLRDLPLEKAEALRQEFAKVAIVTIERPALKPEPEVLSWPESESAAGPPGTPSS